MSSYGKEILLNQPKMSLANAADFLKISIQGVHKQLKSKGLTCPKLGNKSYITYDIAKKLFNINFNKKKVAGQIVKGGTGKTTTITNIASCANTYGARVLLIDADPQGNLTDANGIDAEAYPVLIDVIKGDAAIEDCIIPVSAGLDLISSRIENVILDNEIVNKRLPLDKLYSGILQSVENNYDYIFIDCPPTMGQAVACASLYVDVILAPLNPDKFSAKGLKILKQEVEALNRNYQREIEYRVYLNKFSSKTILSDKAIVSLISDPELEGKVLSTTVQFTQEIPNITDENKNVFNVVKKSSVRDDFDRLTRELLDIYPETMKKVDDEKEYRVQEQPMYQSEEL
jgi:chromosome partitioning protein